MSYKFTATKQLSKATKLTTPVFDTFEEAFYYGLNTIGDVFDLRKVEGKKLGETICHFIVDQQDTGVTADE